MKIVELSPLTCMQLWGELVECYHGKNSYGGDTAEIYAYRLKVGIESNDQFSSMLGREAQHNTSAAMRLVDLIRLFQLQYTTKITIDEEPIDTWLSKAYSFSHRCHVKVEKV